MRVPAVAALEFALVFSRRWKKSSRMPTAGSRSSRTEEESELVRSNPLEIRILEGKT